MEQTVRPDSSLFKVEGTLGTPVRDINNLNQYAQAFLPYNPTIVEIGAHEGAGTVSLAETYRYGRIFACEPNPRPFAALAARLRTYPHARAVQAAIGAANGAGTLWVPPAAQAASASLLPPQRAADGGCRHRAIPVTVMTLDDWCRRHALSRVEFLRLDAGGFELQILQHASRTLGTALVVVTRTSVGRPGPGTISFPVLRLFLEMSGFELLSHWYQEGAHGEATFVRKVLYDSVFR